jgi:hypothetical protein
MAYETGTATNHLDLLNQLVTFLTTNSGLTGASPSQAWTVNRNVVPPTTPNPAGAPISTDREVQLQAPGLAGTDEWFCSITTNTNVAADTYNWLLYGQVGYLPIQGAALQPGGMPSPVVLPLWENTIDFWFVANGRRCIVVAKVSGTYHMMYLGAMLPYGTPSQYPYPMFVGGSNGVVANRWSDAGHSSRNFWNPGQPSSCALYYLDGTWQYLGNTDINGNPSDNQNVWPYGGDSNVRALIANTRENLDGSYPILPMELMDVTGYPSQNVLGTLDGIYWVPGFDLAAEDTLDIGGQTYLIVQNIFQTDTANYCALLLA